MAQDNITSDSRAKLIKGIKKVSDVLAPSYGAAGCSVIIQESFRPFYRATLDGKLIIDSIQLEDPIEQIAKNILAEATDQAEKESGDSRKTTALLTSAILQEEIKEKVNPMEVARSLNECIPIIFDAIDKQTRQINVEQVKDVAMTSCGDEKISELIRDIYKEIGRNGIIELDTSNIPESFFEMKEGFRIRTGCFGYYSLNEPINSPTQAVFKEPLILVSKEKISSVDQLEDIFKMLKANGKGELVIYTEDIDPSVASKLAITHHTGGFKTLVIKAPVLWKDWIYEDLTKLTGATPISLKEGKTFKNFSMPDLGTCKKIVSTPNEDNRYGETRLIGTRDISEHIKKLEDLARTDDQIKLRISWLQTKIAILKVGGNSETEIGRVIKKAKDACAASYWALQGGIVVGGGIPVLDVSKSMPDTIGGYILSRALKIPIRQMMINAGYYDLVKCKRVHWWKFWEKPLYDRILNSNAQNLIDNKFGGHIGFNTRSNSVVNMFDAGIVDSAIITKAAVKNAISIAGTNLTAGSVITTPKPNIHYIQQVNGLIPGM